MDTDYLKTHLGQCLADCLTEVSEKRPHDPIEYIAQWLYKHIDNVKTMQQEESDAIQLVKEAEEFAQQQERDEKMKEEKRRLKEEEAQKQKELEAQATTGLPPLAEGDEPQDPPQITIEVQDETAEQDAEEQSPRAEVEPEEGEVEEDQQQQDKEDAAPQEEDESGEQHSQEKQDPTEEDAAE